MRRWVSEPILAGMIAIVLYILWMLSYSSQRTSTGVSPSGGAYVDGWGLAVRMLAGVAIFAVPVVIWAGLAIGGGFLVRRRTFGLRLLMAWLAAVALSLPFAIAAGVSLSASDGWGGLGILRLIIPAAVPFLVVPLYCLAAALLHFGRRRGPTKDAVERDCAWEQIAF